MATVEPTPSTAKNGTTKAIALATYDAAKRLREGTLHGKHELSSDEVADLKDLDDVKKTYIELINMSGERGGLPILASLTGTLKDMRGDTTKSQQAFANSFRRLREDDTDEAALARLLKYQQAETSSRTPANPTRARTSTSARTPANPSRERTSTRDDAVMEDVSDGKNEEEGAQGDNGGGGEEDGTEAVDHEDNNEALDRSENESLKRQVEELKRKTEWLQEENEHLQEEKEQLQEEKEHLQEEKEQLQDRLLKNEEELVANAKENESDEMRQLKQELRQLQQEMRQLRKEKNECAARRLMLECENESMEKEIKRMEDHLSSLKAQASTLNTSLELLQGNNELLTAVREELLLKIRKFEKKFGKFKEETTDRLEVVEASADENREDVGNLRNDHDDLATGHHELVGDVANDRERRELKEDKYDEDIYHLEQDNGDIQERMDELEANIVDEDQVNEIADTAGKNATNNAIDFMHDDWVVKQDDIEGNNQRLDNEVSNVKDDMGEMRLRLRGVEQALAEQAKRPNRRMSFPP